jgi:hypothetical protein
VELDYLPVQRSLFSFVFIPHESFTPQNNVHSSMRGSAVGGYPFWGPRASGPLTGVRGRSP